MINQNITTHFKWHEAVFLRRWNVYVYPDESTAKNIIRVAEKLELIRSFLNAPLIITSWYRPPMYNQLIGGARGSKHMNGSAVDFQPRGLDIIKCKKALITKLESFDIRLENNGGGNWIHIDLGPVLKNRYFLP